MSQSFPDYSQFSLVQFLEDSFFQDWVLRPDAESEAFWQDFLYHHPTHHDTVAEAKLILKGLRQPVYSLSQEEVDGVWEKIQTQTRPINRPLMVSAYMTYAWIKPAATAIAAVLLLGLGLIWWSTTTLEVRTAYAGTQQVTLPDGSSVILNSNSSLRYPKYWFWKSCREVSLDGEAYFSVTHLEDNRPFIVTTANGVAVEVLGTTFSVYNRAKKSQVVLQEGTVALSITEADESISKILMEPGDLVTIEDQQVEKKKVNPKNYTSWTENLLLLDETSLAEILRIARENLGLEVEVDPEVSMMQTASGSMPLQDGDQFMQLTAKIFNLSIEKSQSKYFIKP